MVEQYPHSIQVKWRPKPTKDTNGDWVQGTEQTFTGICRAEINGKGITITGADGSTIQFSFSVYLPKTTQVIPFGAAVEITMATNHVVKGEVKQQQNGQLNTRLWV